MTTILVRRANLFLMWLPRRTLVVALIAALAAYALDCVGMTTPEQAMQCCNSMRCPSHDHHGQDCCKTMPTMHSVLCNHSPTAKALAPPQV